MVMVVVVVTSFRVWVVPGSNLTSESYLSSFVVTFYSI